VSVDPVLCIGSGTCVHLAPETFFLDDDGVADVSEPVEDDLDLLQRAARSCPASAISVETAG
jgi:ferredoxin